MKKNLLLLVLAMIVAMVDVTAQSSKSGFSLQFGCVKPGRQFNDMPNVVVPGTNSFGQAGGAMTGASFGMKYTYQFNNTILEKSGLGISLAVDAMWNAMNKELRTTYDNVSCTKPNYVNVPIQLGFSYRTPGRIFNVWAEYSLGADLFMKTQEGWRNGTIKYQMSTEFATQLGFGILLARTVSLGAHYYWLGTHDVRPQSENLLNPGEQMKVGAWVFKLGLHF